MMTTEGPKLPNPEEFAGSVAQSNGYEFAAAQTALVQSRTPQIRSFAQQMLADHERMAGALRDAAKASGLEPPRSEVGGDQSRFLSSLQSLRGSDFDREYARQQMLAHIGALTVMRSYAEKGSDRNLSRFAASSVPIIEQHLESARSLSQSFA